jgi:hypothetical protein
MFNIFKTTLAIAALAASAYAKPEFASNPALALVPLVEAVEPTLDCATLIGTWEVTVQPNGGPSFTAYNVFTADGNSIEFDNSGAPSGQTVAVGPWKRTGDHKYAFVEINQLFDDTGFAGTLKVKATITLNDAGDQFTSTFQFTVMSPAGQAVFSGTGTATAKRVTLN